MTSVRHFADSVTSVREARRFVAECARDAPSEVLDSLLFMVSELATNSVIHAETSFSVSVERSGEVLRVVVTDEGEGEPEMRSPESTDARGRGLWIVAELSDAWGVIPAHGGLGKSVWFAVEIGPEWAKLSRSSV